MISTIEWVYNPKASYVSNQTDWTYTVNDERKAWKDEPLSSEVAILKFQELYPKEVFNNGTT